jgi:zinc protease
VKQKFSLKIILGLLLTTLGAPSLFAQPIPLDPAVRTGKLANGFTYYIRHNEEPKNRVLFYLVNKVGSVLEDEDQQGLAHFMEHMNFNGTRHFPKNQLVDYLQRIGVRFGADLNANTSFDQTVFQLPLPADDSSVLLNGFAIMHDWAQGATLDSAEIEKERGVVLEEKRLDKGAGQRMRQSYFPMLVNDSRYAQRQTIGLESVLLHFTPATIRRFHQDWYRPDLQALIVVGDIDAARAETLVRQMFGDLTLPSPERPRPEYTIPLSGHNHFLEVTDGEMPVTQFQIIVKHKATPTQQQQDYVLAMQKQLFNQMLAGRLSELSQQADPPFLQTGAGIQGFLGGLELFAFNLNAKEGRLEQGVRTAWGEITRIRKEGFTASELDRARENYVKNMELAFREKDKTPSVNLVQEYQELFLNKEAAPGLDWEYQFVKTAIGTIRLEDIDALAKNWITDDNRDILILAPEKERNSLPDSITVTRWLNETGSQQLALYKDETISQPLMPERPVGGKVIAEKNNPSVGLTQWTLSNGIRLVLKPTAFRNDEIRFIAFSPGGTSLYADQDYDAAALSAYLIPGFGVAAFNPVQLGKVLNGKHAEVSPFITERTEGLSGSASPEDLETALQWINLSFTHPRKDTVLFNNFIQRYKESLAHRYDNPAAIFGDTIEQVLGGYAYRRSALTLQRLDKISLEKTWDIYNARFADASGFTFVFVGNFKPDSLRPLLESYLGSLPAAYRHEKAKDLGIQIPAGSVVKTVYGGSEDKALVRMVFSGDYPFAPEENLRLSALAEVLQIRLIRTLREEEGQTYSPSVHLEYAKYPRNRFSVTINFGCAPANVDRLTKLVVQQVSGLRDKGPLAEDVEKWKAESRRTHELEVKDNGFWLTHLADAYENGTDAGDVLEYNKQLEKITPLSIRTMAGKYFSPENRMVFVLKPRP